MPSNRASMTRMTSATVVESSAHFAICGMRSRAAWMPSEKLVASPRSTLSAATQSPTPT